MMTFASGTSTSQVTWKIYSNMGNIVFALIALVTSSMLVGIELIIDDMHRTAKREYHPRVQRELEEHYPKRFPLWVAVACLIVSIVISYITIKNYTEIRNIDRVEVVK